MTRKFHTLALIKLLIILIIFAASNWLITGTSFFSVSDPPEEQNTCFSELEIKSAALKDFSDMQNTSFLKTESISLPFTGFIQNLGQLIDDTIQYYYVEKNWVISFAPSTIKFITLSDKETTPSYFSIRFPGSYSVIPEARNRMNYVNYFYGDAQYTNVPGYAEVWYKDLYPCIDLRYYMSTQGLKYDFIVYPGADPSQISLQVSNSVVLSIEDYYVSLKSCTQASQFQFQDTSLEVWQADGTSIPAKFIPKKTYNTYGFQVGSFDHTQTLIIDPLWLSFGSFLGGNHSDTGLSITTDAIGNFYITGYTYSLNFLIFPFLSVYDNSHNGLSDVFVAKFNHDSKIILTTYIGGNGTDRGNEIAVDATGNIYITGSTASSDFPVVNALDNTYNGLTDVFVTKLNAMGDNLLFSTYFGGSHNDWGSGIVVDTNGSSYITGSTASSDFPVSRVSYQSAFGGDFDAFLMKLDTNGGLLFSTFLGGSLIDLGKGISVDNNGNSYITGTTTSNDFPTTSNVYNNALSGATDVFITKFNATGNELIFSTYLGGNDAEGGSDITVDTAGNSYIIGDTQSSNFPLQNAYDSTLGGQYDIFVTKLNATGNGLNFSTYLGGSNGNDFGEAIAIDTGGNSYITGYTNATNFPIQDAYQSFYGGGTVDACAVKLNASGNGLVFSTYFGGNESDEGLGITLDNIGFCYVTGFTVSSDFPLSANAFQSVYKGEADVIMLKFMLETLAPAINLVSPANSTVHPSGTLITLNITDDMSGIDVVLHNWDGNTNVTLIPPYNVALPVGNDQHELSIYAKDSAGNWASRTYVFTTDDPTSTSTVDFLNIEVFLLALACLVVFLLRKRKQHAR